VAACVTRGGDESNTRPDSAFKTASSSPRFSEKMVITWRTGQRRKGRRTPRYGGGGVQPNTRPSFAFKAAGSSPRFSATVIRRPSQRRRRLAGRGSGLGVSEQVVDVVLKTQLVLSVLLVQNLIQLARHQLSNTTHASSK